MDPYLNYIIVFIAITGALILAILLTIVLIRLYSFLTRKIFKSKAEEWENAFLNYLEGDLNLEETVRIFGRGKNYKWLWIFFYPYLNLLSGSDLEKTLTLCHAIGLVAYNKSKLQLGSVTKKASAARALGSLRSREAIPEMFNFLQSKNPLLVQATAQGLARPENLDTFDPVARALISNTNFTFEGISEILSGYGKEACSVIVELLKEKKAQRPRPDLSFKSKITKNFHPTDQLNSNALVSYYYVLIMIDLLGYFRYDRAVQLLHKMLDTADQETTVHILKSFKRMGTTPPNFDIKLFLAHQYWVVRSFAAQLCSLAADINYIPKLESLLSDPHWWVRYHAAEALYSTGQEGLDVLSRKAKESAGASAAISRYILERSVL